MFFVFTSYKNSVLATLVSALGSGFVAGGLVMAAMAFMEGGEGLEQAAVGAVLAGCGYLITRGAKKLALRKERKQVRRAAVCPRCGTALEAGDLFCVGCGKRIEVEGSAGQHPGASGDFGVRKSAGKGILIAILLAIAAAWAVFALRGNGIEGSWSMNEQGGTIIMSFEKNGYGTVEAIYGEESASTGFIYEFHDGMLYITSGERRAEAACEIKGKKMYLSSEGESLVLEKIS